MSLLDPGSYIMCQMVLFHDHAMILLVGIFTFVVLLGSSLLKNKFHGRLVHEAQTLEIIWTIVPAILLVWLALPSLRLLYLMDEHPHSSNTLKAIGHQWYWSYELPSKDNMSMDSYMLPESSLMGGQFRLLEVDNRPSIPFAFDTMVITTSSDVIHAWTLPSLGIKMDAVPGRLNSMNINPFTPGIFYGQCSEICGANHSYMPIVLEAISMKDFINL
uniref:cytochrome c oxidase subunit II n=1 Tax=Arion flagellus TaxID=236857 RepID=UPI00240FADE4|nr:cytochrome c oxidase subunit II [Arion flagellus]WES82237.1 cytochrome c oxidase subunit II [Arion flagellus]